MNSKIIKEIERIIPKENIKTNEVMSKHTSFKIGGPAEVFIKINTIDELKGLLNIVDENKEKLTVIGNGSNILVKDNGIKGIVAKINLKEVKFYIKDNQKIEVAVDSGVQLGYLAQILLKQEIQGFEELSGIPGTIGGAVTMNAGAHGKEIKDIIQKIIAIDYKGNIQELTKEDGEFEYRNSRFSKGDLIVLQAVIELEKGNKEQIKMKMDEYAKYRKDKQPIEFPNAGSTFKRGTDFITAQLIEQAGLKGYSIGGAEVSTKHSGFIINKGNATAQDVLELVKYIKEKVYEKFEKTIELEIKIIGE